VYTDIVSLRHFRRVQENENGVIDVAFPVLAIECEAYVPSAELDAYEEAALKLVEEVKLSTKGIAKTLKIADSLAGQLMYQLEKKQYISRKMGCPWETTDEGKEYLKGIREPRPSDKSRYGYMFVSAIKKDILQYFHDGDINRIERSHVSVGENKLKLGNESAMFNLSEPVKLWKLNLAYKRYLQNRRLEEKLEKNRWEGGEMTLSDAQDAYASAELFENADSDSKPVEEESTAPMGAAEIPKERPDFVRQLKRPVQRLYLQMRIKMSPEEPEGFSVESPLDLNGIDNEFFRKQQIRWMKELGQVYLADKKLSEILDADKRKSTGQQPGKKKSRDEYIGEYVMEKMPLLYDERDGRYKDIYTSAGHYIYKAMTGKNTGPDKEDIVSGINRKLLEVLMNMLLRTVKLEMLVKISNEALNNIIRSLEARYFTTHIAKISCVSKDLLSDNRKWIENVVRDLGKKYIGSSIFAKLYNVLVVYTYGKSNEIERFVKKENLEDYIRKLKKLNDIRNVAAHADKGKANNLKDEEYDYYIANFSDVANRLLESLKKEVSGNE
jgi:hypothetical protein